jgi:hypothetical protein
MNDRERAIIAQVAAKAAAELCHGMGRDGMTDYLACSEMVFSDILDKIGDEPADVPAAAAAPVMPPALSPVTQAQAAFPGAEVTSAAVPATPPPPAAAAKPPGGARKKKMLDANGFVTDDKQAAWNVAFLCAGCGCRMHRHTSRPPMVPSFPSTWRTCTHAAVRNARVALSPLP